MPKKENNKYKLNHRTKYTKDTQSGQKPTAKSVVRKEYAVDTRKKTDEKPEEPKKKIRKGDCPYSDKCGGCDYQGLSYVEQLSKKQKRVNFPCQVRPTPVPPQAQQLTTMAQPAAAIGSGHGPGQAGARRRHCRHAGASRAGRRIG